MSETSYVPTDQRVRHSASTEGAWLAYAPGSFDRWLAAHDAEVRAETLEEAAQLALAYEASFTRSTLKIAASLTQVGVAKAIRALATPAETEK